MPLRGIEIEAFLRRNACTDRIHGRTRQAQSAPVRAGATGRVKSTERTLTPGE